MIDFKERREVNEDEKDDLVFVDGQPAQYVSSACYDSESIGEFCYQKVMR